jgi:hypothetical protein
MHRQQWNRNTINNQCTYQSPSTIAGDMTGSHYTVIERMLPAVENETLRLSPVRLLRLMAQQGCELCQKRNHGLLNYASLNYGCAYCSDCLRENLEEVLVAEIYRRSSKVVQFQTFSNTIFKPNFYRMMSYKVIYHLKKKVGEKYGGPIQESSLCSTRLQAGSLTSAEWILLGRDNYKRIGRMTYFTDVSSTPEFKTYEGTKKKVGGFDKMWNMPKKEAGKKPQDLSITIIDRDVSISIDFLNSSNSFSSQHRRDHVSKRKFKHPTMLRR